MASDDPVDVSGDVPLACSLTAAELRVRGEENASLFARAHDTQELPDGYCFAFPAEDDAARNLLQFVLAERACCPFFTFELTFPSPHHAIYLTVRGREGVKEIVRASVASTRRGYSLHARVRRAGDALVLVRLRLRYRLLWRLRLWMARWRWAVRPHRRDVGILALRRWWRTRAITDPPRRARRR